MSSDLFIQPEDLIKIANTLLDHSQMKANLKQQMIEYIEQEHMTFSYEILSELAVVYAMKMDDTYKKMFFSKLRMRFIKEIEYLSDETLYKILWAFFKAKAITIQTSNPEWQAIKEILVKKSKDIGPKVLTDILVIATTEEREAGSAVTDNDLFTQIEADVILKMKEMNLDDLINLLWSALEIGKGSQLFYQSLEGELAKRIRGIKDEQFSTLIACFQGDKGDASVAKFTSKFLDLVIKVIKDKRDRFSLSTIVNLLWSCSKIDFSSERAEIIEMYQDYAQYERLIRGMPMMQQKSLAILIWTYTRDMRLMADQNCRHFVEKAVDAMLQYQTQSLTVDNFDLLLLAQSITHIQDDQPSQNILSKLIQLAKQLDAYALKNIDRMSVHEFVSISSFYLGLLSDGVCSKALAEAFLGKIQDSVTEFNEL